MTKEKKYLYKGQEVYLIYECEHFLLIKYANRHIFSEIFEWINPKDLKEVETINEIF